MTPATAQPGTISQGTLRACDLSKAYLEEIDRQGLALDDDFRQLLSECARHACETVADSESVYVWEALRNAESILGNAAPFGYYFGDHFGDGSDLGYWITDEWSDALEERCIAEGDQETVLSICEDEGLEPDGFCDAWQGEVQAYSAERAGAVYAQEYAEDSGMIADCARWPCSCIDWHDAWLELAMGDGCSVHQLDTCRWGIIRAV